MIAQENMMPVLIEACPSFAPQWEAFQEEWRTEPVDLPHYLVMADFARHLINQLERGDTAGFPEVFGAIERLHREGEHYVREAVTVGLLESLQNHNLHPNGTDPEQFRPYLGPETTRWWDKLHRYWEHGELLIED